MKITPGYRFTATEPCTAEKLRKLVEEAALHGIDLPQLSITVDGPANVPCLRTLGTGPLQGATALHTHTNIDGSVSIADSSLDPNFFADVASIADHGTNLSSFVAGDLVYVQNGAYARLPLGQQGQVLAWSVADGLHWAAAPVPTS